MTKADQPTRPPYLAFIVAAVALTVGSGVALQAVFPPDETAGCVTAREFVVEDHRAGTPAVIQRTTCPVP